MIKAYDLTKLFEHPKLRTTDTCWVWTGKPNQDGYPRWHLHRGKEALLHRTAWEITNGPIPRGMCVLHHCDNPMCINPSHLFLGTQADNIADKMKKGRQAKGEKIGVAKLNAEKVMAIKAASRDGKSQRMIANGYGVSQSTVWRALTGFCWKHVPVDKCDHR